MGVISLAAMFVVTYMSRPPHLPQGHSQTPRHIDSIKDNYKDDDNDDDDDDNNKNGQSEIPRHKDSIKDNQGSKKRPKWKCD